MTDRTSLVDEINFQKVHYYSCSYKDKEDLRDPRRDEQLMLRSRDRGGAQMKQSLKTLGIKA